MSPSSKIRLFLIHRKSVVQCNHLDFFLIFKKFILLYFFIFVCVGSSLLHTGFLQLWRDGATLCCDVVGFSLLWFFLLWSTGSRRMQPQQLWLAGSVVVARGLQSAGSVVVACGLQSTGSVVVVHGLSCSAACGIFPDQGPNPCPLHS